MLTRATAVFLGSRFVPVSARAQRDSAERGYFTLNGVAEGRGTI